MTAFLLTWSIHLTVLLAAAWLAERRGWLRHRRQREFAWLLALFGGLLTAGLQSQLPSDPLAGSWPIDATTVAATPSQAGSETEQAVIEPPPSPTGNGVVASTQSKPEEAPVSDQPHMAWPTLSLENLLAGWAAITAFLLLHLAFRLGRVRRSLAHRKPIVRGDAADTLHALSQRAGIATPRLSRLADLPGPVTLPGGEICLPTWAEHELSRDQLEALLAHELAHVKRHDPERQILLQVLLAVFFFHPLVHLACRRLEILAELACDDWAATQSRDGRALAECLGLCAGRLSAQSRHGFSDFAYGSAMATRRSSLIARVQRLLHGHSEPVGASIMKTVFFSAVALVVMAVCLPVVTQTATARTTDDGWSVFENRTDNDKVSLSISNHDMKLRVRAEGDFEFTAQENDIASMDDDAWLDIMLDKDGVEHEFRFEGGDTIQREYERDGDVMAWGPQAQAALADILPTVLRETTWQARKRVARLLEQGAVDRVIEEIRLIHSDHATRHYIELLVEARPDISADNIATLAQTSDSIGSDFELRNVLVTLATLERLDNNAAQAILETSYTIGSDFEMRNFIAESAAPLLAELQDADALVEALDSIGSDFEMRQAMSAIMHANGGPMATATVFQLAADRIGSDFEMRSLLAQHAELVTDLSTAQAYAAAISSIGSDFEQREALAAFAKHADVEPEGWVAVINAAETIGSDFEAAEALLVVIANMPDDPAVNAAVKRVLKGIGSDFEHDRVAARLASR